MYVWQMNGGRWHVDHYTSIGFDIRMRELDRGYGTKADAETALAEWRKRFPDAIKPRY